MPDCFKRKSELIKVQDTYARETVLFLHSLVVLYLILMPPLSFHAIYINQNTANNTLKKNRVEDESFFCESKNNKI